MTETGATCPIEPDEQGGIDHQHFDIQRSARYHDRRMTHYERLHRVTNVVTVMLSGVVMLDFLGAEIPCYIKLIAFAGALLGACDLVIGFSRCGNQHRNLKRRFITLERDLTEEKVTLKQLRSQRLDIESEEPAIHRALDVLCYIETCAALGKVASAYLPWYMRLSAQWLHWSNAGTVAIETYQRRMAKAANHNDRGIS
jgi:hypothetical protein